MKQRNRKKPLYRRILEAQLAEIVGLMKSIAVTLPEPATDHDEYHKIPGKLASEWTTGHTRVTHR